MEVEFKLVALPGEPLEPEAVHAVARRLGELHPPRPVPLDARYHPADDLQAARWTLRARQEGLRWVAAAKGPSVDVEGVPARVEVEADIPGPPDAGAPLPSALVSALADAGLERDRWPGEGWRVAMQRSAARLRVGELEVELAVDHGRVQALWQHAELRELEIELVRGEPGGIRELAFAFAAELGLRPGAWSKAQRGLAITGRLGAPREPATDDPPRVWWRHLGDLEERIRAGARNLDGAWWGSRYAVVAKLDAPAPLDPEGTVRSFIDGDEHTAWAWQVVRAL